MCDGARAVGDGQGCRGGDGVGYVVLNDGCWRRADGCVACYYLGDLLKMGFEGICDRDFERTYLCGVEGAVIEAATVVCCVGRGQECDERNYGRLGELHVEGIFGK